MYLQNDPAWKHLPMAKEGCASLSALWFVSKRGKLPPSVSEVEEAILHMIFAEMHTDEISPIAPDCEVNSYDAIAEWFGIKVIKPARHENAKYICEQGEEEILVWLHHGTYHFTAGNGRGIVTYDPLGYWCEYYKPKLVSKRVITWQRSAPSSAKGG